jgi:hypothetical protein
MHEVRIRLLYCNIQHYFHAIQSRVYEILSTEVVLELMTTEWTSVSLGTALATQCPLKPATVPPCVNALAPVGE